MTDEQWKEYECQAGEKCSLTLAEHEAGMLCWGLAYSVEQGIEMNCGGCEFAQRGDAA